MKKLAYLLLLAALLAACGPSGSPEPGSDLAEETGQTSPTEQIEAGAEEETAPAAAGESKELEPALSPEEAAVVREQDYVLGAVDPAVTIIEYGDFQ